MCTLRESTADDLCLARCGRLEESRRASRAAHSWYSGAAHDTVCEAERAAVPHARSELVSAIVRAAGRMRRHGQERGQAMRDGGCETLQVAARNTKRPHNNSRPELNHEAGRDTLTSAHAEWLRHQ